MWLFKDKEALEINTEGTLTGQNIVLRPTKLCFTMTVLSLAIWVGAVNYQVNVAYAICFWVLGFIGISALMTYRQLLGLQTRIIFTDEVFAGQTAAVSIEWSSPDAKRQRLFWWCDTQVYDDTDDYDDNHHKWNRADVSGSLNETWSIPIERRGYFPRLLLLRLATSAPFGLFHAECHIEWQSDAVAYAAPLSHQEFGSLTPDPEQTPQQTGTHGEDIAFLKPHMEGASLQHISWKAYAKRGELLDKVFDEPPPSTHNEIISYQDYPSGTPSDKLASLLTHRVLQADKLGAPYTLILPTQTFTPQNGLREKCLNALALM